VATYFTNIGPVQGPFLNRDVTAAIGVLKARDKHMPVGPDVDSVALWRLTIGDVEVPGLWRVVDWAFRPAR
jgi:hypothetical protein